MIKLERFHLILILAIGFFLIITSSIFSVWFFSDCSVTILPNDVKSAPENVFVWLGSSHFLKVYSNGVSESEPDRKADKLIDGDIGTLAYPGYNCCDKRRKEFDYIIELTDKYAIKRVDLVWGDDGLDSSRIQWWSLESLDPDGYWSVIESSDETPHVSTTTINMEFEASALRISAGSRDNWVGMAEVKILGKLR